MPRKGIRLYDPWMAHTTPKRLSHTEAPPLTFTVELHNGYWVVRAWYHGRTMAEALRPVLVGEKTLPHDQAPPAALWGELYRAVAIAIEEFAMGEGVLVHEE